MLKPESLLVYPYVKVRVSCECGYRKAYRLARLAQHYGADIALDDLLFHLMHGRCPLWGENATFLRLRCKLTFTDISSNNPPDVPPSASRPKLVGK
jgi:hypothetical protein